MSNWATQDLYNLAFVELLRAAGLRASIGQHELALKIASTPIPNEESFRQVYRDLGNDEWLINMIIERLYKDASWDIEVGPWCNEPVDCGKCILPPWHRERCTRYIGP